MPKLATWMRRKDEKYFAPFFAGHPEVEIWNAANRQVPTAKMDGFLLTGGADISPEFLNHEIADVSVIEKEADHNRDGWELRPVNEATAVHLPILAILHRMHL